MVKQATDRQVAFISRLMDERDLFASAKWCDAVNGMSSEEYDEHVAHFKSVLVPELTSQQASAWIDALLALPLKDPAANVGGATEKQVSFIERLLSERDLGETYESYPEVVEMLKQNKQLTRETASGFIETLLSLPAKSTGSAPASADSQYEIPAGRYAAEREDGVLAFYRLDRPTEGRWAGYAFLSVQASDELHPIKGHAAKEAILSKIAEDPAGAARRYGQEIGSCAICGRTLTDETSREYGIGPVCRERTGW